MPDWVDAETLEELNNLFVTPPPMPSSIPPPIKEKKTPLKVPNITQDNNNLSTNKQYQKATNISSYDLLNIYDDSFNIKSLDNTNLHKKLHYTHTYKNQDHCFIFVQTSSMAQLN